MEHEYKFRTFNVCFLNDRGKTDETQFDIAGNSYFGDWDQDLKTGFMMVQLLDLCEQFRQENKLMYPEILSVVEVPYSEE